MATVYIESSVISYYTARPSRDLLTAAHQQITSEWWDKALPKLTPYISRYVLEEIEKGDAGAAKKRIDAAQTFLQLQMSRDVADLAAEYVRAIAIPGRAYTDAIHVALAVWHGMDYLVTWNCTHIAGARAQRELRQINDRNGLFTPGICTPEELMNV